MKVESFHCIQLLLHHPLVYQYLLPKRQVMARRAICTSLHRKRRDRHIILKSFLLVQIISHIMLFALNIISNMSYLSMLLIILITCKMWMGDNLPIRSCMCRNKTKKRIYNFTSHKGLFSKVSTWCNMVNDIKINIKRFGNDSNNMSICQRNIFTISTC